MTLPIQQNNLNMTEPNSNPAEQDSLNAEPLSSDSSHSSTALEHVEQPNPDSSHTAVAGVEKLPASPTQMGFSAGLSQQQLAARRPRRSLKGRPTNEFVLMVRHMADKPKVRKQVQDILNDKDHKHFAAIYKLLLSYGYGMPQQNVQVTGDAANPVAILPAIRAL